MSSSRRTEQRRKGKAESDPRRNVRNGSRASSTFSNQQNDARTQETDHTLQSLTDLIGTTVTISTKLGQKYEGLVESTSGEGDTRMTLKDVKKISIPDAPPEESLSALQIRVVPFNIPVYNDSGSGARLDLATWKPSLQEGWFYFGPAASNGSSDCVGIVAKPIDPDAIAPIVHWVKVWDNAGSWRSTNFSLWRGMPPDVDKYTVVGGFFAHSNQEPTDAETRGIVAIRNDLLSPAFANRQVWTDIGTGARTDGAVWTVSTREDPRAICIGAFIPTNAHNISPDPVYNINRAKVTN